MKVKFDGWSEKAWFPAGPDLECEEEFEEFKKKDGGRAFSTRGRVFISKGARWRRALFWHERGHCLLFEAGRHRSVKSSLKEEIAADTIAEVLAGRRQILGMLAMLLKRSKPKYVHEIVQRINAVVDRHPAESLKVLEKMPGSTRLAAIVNPLKEKYYGML